MSAKPSLQDIASELQVLIATHLQSVEDGKNLASTCSVLRSAVETAMPPHTYLDLTEPAQPRMLHASFSTYPSNALSIFTSSKSMFGGDTCCEQQEDGTRLVHTEFMDQINRHLKEKTISTVIINRADPTGAYDYDSLNACGLHELFNEIPAVISILRDPTGRGGIYMVRTIQAPPMTRVSYIGSLRKGEVELHDIATLLGDTMLNKSTGLATEYCTVIDPANHQNYISWDESVGYVDPTGEDIVDELKKRIENRPSLHAAFGAENEASTSTAAQTTRGETVERLVNFMSKEDFDKSPMGRKVSDCLSAFDDESKEICCDLMKFSTRTARRERIEDERAFERAS